MKIAICPDIHGRTFWKDVVGHTNEYDKIVFIGDYIDPYEQEGITRNSTIDNFKEIIDFRKANNDKVILLMGNHDISYVNSMMPKSRYDYDNANEINKLFTSNRKLFNLAYETNVGGKRYIFSHSGIMMGWVEEFKEMYEWDKPDQNNVVDFINNNFQISEDYSASILYMVSRYRGGWDKYGSCVWGDFREFVKYMDSKDTEKIENSYQIFGHTQLKEPIVTKEYACLDARRIFILDDGLLKEMNGDIIPEKVLN